MTTRTTTDITPLISALHIDTTPDLNATMTDMTKHHLSSNRTILRIAAVTLFLLAPFAVGISAQQTTHAGPLIESAGAVFAVSPTFTTPTDRDYKVAFEVAIPSPDPANMNQRINTVARFLNMHAQAGVPEQQLSGAIVAHGAASFELLDDEAYRTKFGVDNPNSAVIRELIAAGQPVILCGQSAASRGVPIEGLIPGVQVALSAITAFVVLQDEGYRVNPW
jgi:intracellular sulfur oxidation DsrE/DsrF family protein